MADDFLWRPFAFSPGNLTLLGGNFQQLLGSGADCLAKIIQKILHVVSSVLIWAVPSRCCMFRASSSFETRAMIHRPAFLSESLLLFHNPWLNTRALRGAWQPARFH